ncbi:MAG TPA: DUF2851 family protein, partial [bacterium]|nr:DUF2851 family protein [bacterium]
NHHKNNLYNQVKIQMYFYDYDKNTNFKNQMIKPNYHINLSNQLIYPFSEIFENWQKSNTKKNIYPCNISKLKNSQNIHKLIFCYGKKNLNLKFLKIEKYINKYGYLKTLVILISRGLGYGANKNIFTKIALNIDFEKLKKICSDCRRSKVQEIIMQELIKISNYILEKNKITRNWHSLKTRPKNNYIIRLNNLKNLISNILFFDENDFLNYLNTHCSNTKSFIAFFESLLSDRLYKLGDAHTKLIFANAILPFLYVYSKISSDNFYKKRYWNMLYKLSGCLINYKLINICEIMGIYQKTQKKSFIYQLGLLYIHDNFCKRKIYENN